MYIRLCLDIEQFEQLVLELYEDYNMLEITDEYITLYSDLTFIIKLEGILEIEKIPFVIWN